MQPIRNFVTEFEAELRAAEDKPRIPCRDCQSPTVLDVKFDTEKLCDNCITRREQWQQHRDQQRAFRDRQRNSGLPEEFHNLRLSEYKERHGVAAGPVPAELVQPISQRTEIKNLFLRYCTDTPPTHGAFTLGPAGTGKTHLTAALCNRFCYHGYTPRWIDGRALDDAITNEWGKSSREKFFKTRLAEEIAQHDVVFIEDLQIPGAQIPQWYSNALNDILNQLVIKKRLLFVTSNHRRKEALITMDGHPLRGQPKDLWLEKAYGESFTSRLSALCKFYPLTGPDLRAI